MGHGDVGTRLPAAVDAFEHPVDLLVNNAGTAHHGPSPETAAQDAFTAIRLNREAVVPLAHAFLTQARPGDALINVSSPLAYAPAPGRRPCFRTCRPASLAVRGSRGRPSRS
ncbi:SDR family NAD(P)-dependent oxidoreductase [Streptomyces sp. NPDC002033]